jgi:type IV secretion system protein VirB10
LRSASHTPTVELVDTANPAKADAVQAAPKDYSQVPKLGPPLPGDLGGPIVAAQTSGKDVVPPPIGAPPTQNGANDPRQAARQRVAQERDAARTSRLFLGGEQASAAAVPATAETMPALAGTSPNVEAAAPAATGKQAFLDRQPDRTVVSAERLAPPVSPNVLQSGAIIPAALVTGIRSDLPGQIVAQVTQNVYDSPTGRVLLVPQGAKLIGRYDSETSFGQDRVLLAWDRLILPDGRSILLDRQPGADAAGGAGLKDRVDNHWGGILKAALVSTLLSVGAEVGSSSDDDLVRALRQGTSSSINQTGQQVVQRQLGIRPTLTIRPGAPLRVIVTRDLVLEAIGGAR